MGASSTAHGGRCYRYYVCRLSRCPTKAVSAPLIEESVRAQIRLALEREGTRRQLGISNHDWLAFEQGDGERLLRSVIRRICYESATGRVSLHLNVAGRGYDD